MMRPTFLLFSFLIAITAFAGSDKHADFSAVEKSVRKAMPNTKITSIQPSPIDGLVEIVAGRNVLYADPTGRYLLVGNIYDMHTATDLTAERKSASSTIDWKSLPLDAAVKLGSGGSRKLAVFVDPDCGWCRKLHYQLAALDDVEVYAIMFPVTELHPDAANKAANILCADDPSKAFDSLIAGKAFPDSKDTACLKQANSRIGEVKTFSDSHGIHGTPTLVSGDGRIHAGYMDAPSIKAWLDAAKR